MHTFNYKAWTEDVSDDRYFSDEFSDYISNSLLKLVNPAEGGSITRFNNGFKDKFTSKSLELGTSVHRFILEGEFHELGIVDKPKAKIGYVVEEVFKIRSKNSGVSILDCIKAACITKDYYASKITANTVKKLIKEGLAYYKYLRTINRDQVITLTAEDKLIVAACAKTCESLLIGGDEIHNEFPIFIEEINESVLDDTVLLKFKGKIDRWTIDHKKKLITLFDLKTTSYPAVNFVSYEYYEVDANLNYSKTIGLGSFFKYHYYRQLAFYTELLKMYIAKNRPELADYTFRSVILIAETTGANRALLYNIEDKYLMMGIKEFNFLVNIIRDYHNQRKYE